MKIRLHQFLSKCGIFSSKAEVKKAIWDGDITVNGSLVKNISFEFNTNKKTKLTAPKKIEKYLNYKNPQGAEQ